MGTSWDIEDLVGMMQEGKKDPNAKPEPIEIPRRIRIPLLLGAAPDFFSVLMKQYKDKYRQLVEAMQNSGGGPVVELGTLTPEQARDLYKRIGSMVAKARPPTSED